MNTHRPCLVLAIVLTAGIVAGKFFSVPLWVWLIVAAAALAVFAQRRFAAALYAAVFSLGSAWLQQQYLLPPQSLAFASQEELWQTQAVEGSVASDVQDRGGQSVFDLHARRIMRRGQWQASDGKVRVKLRTDYTLCYGQTLRLYGRLRLPFDMSGANGFSYRRYLQENGIYASMRARPDKWEILEIRGGNWLVGASLELRRRMSAVFYRYLHPREAGFVTALVLGDRSGMPRDLKEMFVNTGTAHILAISGMNMTVIVVILFFIFRLSGLPRWAQIAATIAFLFGYAFLSGWSASVVRACIMSSVILASFAFEQESDGFNSLGLAALILLALDPKNIFDVGFQLSFGAVAGILLLHKRCTALFTFLPQTIAATMGVSMAAWLGTAAITFIHFRMITPIAVLANVPIVPLADMIMALGLGLAVCGGWCAPLGYAFAGGIKALLSAMIICAGWFNQIPGGHFIFS